MNIATGYGWLDGSELTKRPTIEKLDDPNWDAFSLRLTLWEPVNYEKSYVVYDSLEFGKLLQRSGAWMVTHENDQP